MKFLYLKHGKEDSDTPYAKCLSRQQYLLAITLSFFSSRLCDKTNKFFKLTCSKNQNIRAFPAYKIISCFHGSLKQMNSFILYVSSHNIRKSNKQITETDTKFENTNITSLKKTGSKHILYVYVIFTSS